MIGLLRLVLIGAIAGLLFVGPVLARSAGAQLPAETLPAETVLETVVPNAGGYVVALAFAPDGRMFYTVKGGFEGDRPAQVRVVEQGRLRATPFLSTTVNTPGERGLLGIAFDPNFVANRHVYVYKTATIAETGTERPSNRVVRYTEDPATGTAQPGSETVLLDVPIGPENDPNANHNGGNLHFGPDGKLYVTIGDYGRNPANAQTLTNLMGKIHRFNPDGSIPAGNPFAGQADPAARSIWTFGNRNSFDFVFDPRTNRLIFTENGPDCDDEVNLGQAGGNYGWGADYRCGEVPDGTIGPLFRYEASIGITGIDVYQGPIGDWDGDLFWCAVTNGSLYRGRLDAARTRIAGVSTIDLGGRCRVDVQHGPDGALYVTAGTTISRIRSTAPIPTPAPIEPRVFLPWVGRGAAAW